ncbi:AP2-like ethylene-responsive transcription factor AIL6 [Cajanus cajan]|uniref:AP2-like ethylene-responsive transcription factor AIL6 n=1 Tax=Cajanus cajan TaxID=3821 RepID=UPI00098DA617|nr:AP2-like ethylene-responsive transcription factor AIL6 [Cajanus cajan]
MARATNWLSFSLSPMEMLRTSEPQFAQYDAASATSSHHYYLDNLYNNAAGWGNGNLKSQVLMEQNLNQSEVSFVDSSTHSRGVSHAPPPKLEDFLGSDSSAVMRYSDSQTETQDSSLTHMYDHHGSAAYFGDHQDLKAIAGFQAFSTNSGSEVDDSASIGKAQPSEFGTHSIESSVNEFNAFSAASGGCGGASGTLSLAVAQSTEKAVVAADSDSSKKVVETFGQRTSIYRGVTRHRWTGRYEAHLWDNSCRREGQARKGRQVYLGGYDKEDKAARAYDLAALKYWGPTATTNFPVSNYSKEVEEMKHVTKQEFIASLRRKSSGFSRGASIYRGVTRHHQQGRWQARIGRVAGNKDLYLGTFATEEEAAEAYDIAAIKFRGANAVTNFEMNRYDVEAIMKSSLPVGGAAKRLKLSLESEQKVAVNSNQQNPQCVNVSGNINFSSIHQPLASIPCGIPFDSTTAYYHHNLFQHFHPNNAGTAASAVTSANATATGLTALPPPSAAEFFIWPHQSY